MRKLAVLLIGLSAMFATVLRADNDKVIQLNQLPAAAQQFIQQHFSGSKVLLVKMDKDIISRSYEVIFEEGSKIDFDSNGAWEEIDCRATAVPEAAIPSKIAKYVKANYPDASIRKIEKDTREYEVKLSNRVELSFDLKFKLIDIDI